MESDYYTEDQFLQAFKIHQGLPIFNFTCRSLFITLEEILAYLNEIRFAFDVITLSETLINTKQKSDLVQLPGCQLCHKDRQEKKVAE